jgi:hypothetical protein
MGDQIGRILFSLGSFLKITEVAQIFGYFFRSISYALILTKTIGWATLWAAFFTNSPGHPDRVVLRNGVCKREW